MADKPKKRKELPPDIFEHQVYTKLFRDETRHIDFILVIRDDGDAGAEKLRVNFVINALRAGLEIEVEYPVLNENKDLLFIKVHAPDKIIHNYGNYLGIRKFFKESHFDFINTDYMERLLNYATPKYEKEWIRLIRQHYPGPLSYSTLERSLIVKRILLTMPFGEYENFYSMNTMLQKNLLDDAYALHDGPYFFAPSQNVDKMNARQILFYQWITKSCFKAQPVHLIQEYFGERIAFYFGYLEFQNFALMIAALVGFITMAMGFADNEFYLYESRFCTPFPHSDVKFVCPECADYLICPYKLFVKYCSQARITALLDNDYLVIYAFFISLWSMLAVTIWRERENYLSWMWELNHHEDLKTEIRPEFFVHRERLRRSKLTGIVQYSGTWINKLIHLTMCSALVILCVAASVAIVLGLVTFKLFLMGVFGQPKKAIAILCVALVDVTLVMILEKLCIKLSYYLVAKEYHRTQSWHEFSLVVKLSGFSFAFSLALLIYFGIGKGLLYEDPIDCLRWMALGLGTFNCGPLSCIPEVWVVLITTIVIKEFVPIFFSSSGGESDYSESKWKNANVPCWEREYKLGNITEEMIVDRYQRLVTQFGFATLFACVLPIAPIFMLISNNISFRRDSKMFLLKCRRATLYKCTGMGAWRYVLFVISYATTFISALVIISSSDVMERFMYTYDYFDLARMPYGEYIFTEHNLTDFSGMCVVFGQTMARPAVAQAAAAKELPGMVTSCFFPGHKIYRKDVTVSSSPYIDSEMGWRKKYLKLKFVVFYQILAVISLMLIHALIPARSKDVLLTEEIEQRIRYKYYWSQGMPGVVKH